MRLRSLPMLAVLVLLALALVASGAPAQPASSAAGPAVVAKKKACKRKKGETKRHWLKRCKCKSFKRGETRKRFKKRCPGAKVPKRKAPTGGGTNPTPAPQPAPAPTQSDADKVAAALNNTQLQYFSYSNSTGASDDERYRFCGNTFQYTRNRIGLSGVAYDSNGAGTWTITAATVNPDGVSGTATLHYVPSSFQSNDPDGPPPNEGDVAMSFNGAKVDLGRRVYDATRITC